MFKRLTRAAVLPINWSRDWIATSVLRQTSYRYYGKTLNVGDLIGPYLLEKLVDGPCRKALTGGAPHWLTVGSILHTATTHSYIWGTGLISDVQLPAKLDVGKVAALRGELTRDAINREFGWDAEVPLGDPALLMPNYYNRNTPKPTTPIGIIPHYVDSERIDGWGIDFPGTRILDVRTHPEQFIDAMRDCAVVLSSSLHGLILADAYGIPNKWITLSDEIYGGDFKFRDYYSTTDCPTEMTIQINSSDELASALTQASRLTGIKVCRYDTNELEGALLNMHKRRAHAA